MDSLISKIKYSPLSDLTSLYDDVFNCLNPDIRNSIDKDRICTTKELDVNLDLASEFIKGLEALDHRIKNDTSDILKQGTQLFKAYTLFLCCLSLTNGKYDCTYMRHRINLIKCYIHCKDYQAAKVQGLDVITTFRSYYFGDDRDGVDDDMLVPDLAKIMDGDVAVMVDDGEIITKASMMMEVVVMFLECLAADLKFQQDDYRTSLTMVNQIQPWILRVDDEDQCHKFHTNAATHLSKCTAFLVVNHLQSPQLVLSFCRQTFLEQTELSSNVHDIAQSWSTIFNKLFSQLEDHPDFYLQVLDLLFNECKNGEEKTHKVFLDVAHSLAKESRNFNDEYDPVASCFVKQAEQLSSEDKSLPTKWILKLYAVALLMEKSKADVELNQTSLHDVLLLLRQCFGISVSSEAKEIICAKNLAYLPLLFSALWFLCEPHCVLINENCEDILGGSEEKCSSTMRTVINEALMLFTDVFRAYSCSALENKRDAYLNIVAAANASFTLSLGTKTRFEENLTFLKNILLDDLVHHANQLKLLRSLHKIGKFLLKNKRLKEATSLVEISSEAAWKCVLHSCRMFISKKPSYRQLDIANAVKEAVALNVTMLNLLEQSGTQSISEKLELFIGRWFDAHLVYVKIAQPVDLVKTWIKILCKGNCSTTGVDLPLHSLMAHIKQQPEYKNIVGRDPKLSKIMEQIISNIILEEMCTNVEGPLHAAWNLIVKGRKQRERGFKSLNKDCIASLSAAITTLSDKKKECDSGPRCLLLAQAYGLRALCKHEAQPNEESSYLEDIQEALDLWSSQEYVTFTEKTQLVFLMTFNLLYRFTDLLSLKVYDKNYIQSKVYGLMIKNCKNKDECFAMLSKSRSLNHALCPSPVSEVCTRAFAEVEGDISTFITPSYYDDWRKSTDQVNVAVCGVETPERRVSTESMFLTSQLYYDLAERLLEKGSTVEALFYAVEARRLRLQSFGKNFVYDVKGRKTKADADGVRVTTKATLESFNMQPSAATSAWDFDYHHDFIVTPYYVLRCTLESTLQVGTIMEILGDGRKAEIDKDLLRWGKLVSSFQGSPVFIVSFSRALAKIYWKQKQNKLAEEEVQDAKNEFQKSCGLLSCSKCRLLLGAAVEEEFGDYLRSTNGLYSAVQHHYETAETYLNDNEWKNMITDPQNVSESNQLLHAPLNSGKGDTWHSVYLDVLKSKSVDSIILMRWEHIRRRCLLGILIKRGNLLMLKGEMEAARDIFLKSISMLVSSSTFSSLDSSVSFTFLAELIQENLIWDECAIENASLLYHISWISIRNFIDKGDSRFIPMPVVVPALKLAFILSRQVPGLLQKVSRLLSVIYTLSPTRDHFSISPSSDVVSECQWATFFQQMTIGTNYSYKLLSREYTKRNENAIADFSCGGSSSSSSSMRFDRLAPESVTELEGFVSKFFQNIPRATVICMTVFKDALLGDLLTGGTQTEASPWIMFSRLSSDCAPLIVVRPIEPIQEDDVTADPTSSPLGISKGTYKVPWGDNIIVDEIAPLFREIIKERNHDFGNSAKKLEKLMGGLLRNMEDKWFGPWKHLLLGEGESLDHDQLDTVLNKVIQDLKSEFDFDVVHQKTLESVLRCAIHTAQEEEGECLPELILKKGCCIDQPSNHTSLGDAASSKSLSIKNLLLDAIFQRGSKSTKRRKIDKESGKRKPVIMMLADDFQMLPVETMSILRNHEVYRMPSFASIQYTLDKCSQNQRIDPTTYFPTIDPLDAYAFVNLKGDLPSADTNFGTWLQSLNIDGIYGNTPIDWEKLTEDQRVAQRNRVVNHDLFIYVGHHDGLIYISGLEIEKHDAYPAAVLAGCSSAAFDLHGPYIPTSAPLHYLAAGSPFVTGSLWTLGGPAVRSIFRTLLQEWIGQRSKTCAECNQANTSTHGCEHQPRIGSFMGRARNATGLINGAALVCYGVPTGISKKKGM